MEIRDDYIFAALAGTLGHANSQFGDGFFRGTWSARMFSPSRESSDSSRCRMRSVDDARLAGASTGDDQQRPVTMR